MDNYTDRYDNDDMILPRDFDDYEHPLYRRKENLSEEYESWEDPADGYDIFPGILRTESKFYPGSWR